jgi:hypothetical protein
MNFEKKFENERKLYEVAEAFEWRKWAKEIPFIDFPAEWLIKAVPPFSGAVIRYNIKHKEIENSFVSVYLDCYSILGVMGEPYWEIHPDEDDDCERFYMNEIDELLEGIRKSFEKQKTKTKKQEK